MLPPDVEKIGQVGQFYWLRFGKLQGSWPETRTHIRGSDPPRELHMFEPKLSTSLVSVEVCEYLPVSGSIYERRYDARGDCTCARFELDACEEWMGVFGNCGCNVNSAAAEFADNKHAMVIACGYGYIVDGVTGELVHKAVREDLGGVITIPGRVFLVACDYCSLFAYTINGLIWRSRRIALDGIELISSTDKVLTGRLWQIDGWHDFSMAFDGWTIDGYTYE